ncbi:MAG TPA: transglycosylase SLT domain-containing protein [Thermodesulfobacteriota bacterium]|nr:transglycosylase SLT domain-containing protein [Thermodesulfobacteriota bacterium]
MNIFTPLFLPGNRASTFLQRIKAKMALHPFREFGKLFVLFGGTIAFVLVSFSPLVQPHQAVSVQEKIGDFISATRAVPDATIKEILHLTDLIRWIAKDPINESQALRYASLISHASKTFRVNPLDIVAIITAESGFKEKSVNAKSGDYGLGQINWEHWGKHNNLTPQELMDPSINIYLTCQVYKFFGEDYGKYHRGNGVKSEAYVNNLKSIHSSLRVFSEMKSKENL